MSFVGHLAGIVSGIARNVVNHYPPTLESKGVLNRMKIPIAWINYFESLAILSLLNRRRNFVSHQNYALPISFDGTHLEPLDVSPYEFIIHTITGNVTASTLESSNLSSVQLPTHQASSNFLFSSYIYFKIILGTGEY